MDGEVSRRVAQEQGRIVHASLMQYTGEQSRRVDVVRSNLTPWSGKLPPLERPPSLQLTDPEEIYQARMAAQQLRRRGGPPPLDPAGAPSRPVPVDLRCRLEDAARWFAEARKSADQWAGLRNFDGWASLDLDPDGGCESSIGQSIQPGASYSRRYLDGKVTDICRALNGIAVKLRDFRVSAPLIDVPPIVRPPRYAQLNRGILARLLLEDLQVRIEAGRRLDESLKLDPSAFSMTWEWSQQVEQVLSGLSPEVAIGFVRLVSGAAACSCPGVSNPASLARAYVSLGMTYLIEAKERMTDYAEASGQGMSGSKVSMTISGGTFIGDINNGHNVAPVRNGATANNVLVNGIDSDLVDALEALRQAVLADNHLDDERGRDLLQNVDYLAEVASVPAEKRNRGIIKSILGALTTAAAGGTELTKVLDAWGGVLHRLLP
jgi:hypothetical protein